MNCEHDVHALHVGAYIAVVVRLHGRNGHTACRESGSHSTDRSAGQRSIGVRRKHTRFQIESSGTGHIPTDSETSVITDSLQLEVVLG
jgi:hypothetical protein